MPLKTGNDVIIHSVDHPAKRAAMTSQEHSMNSLRHSGHRLRNNILESACTAK